MKFLFNVIVVNERKQNLFVYKIFSLDKYNIITFRVKDF